MTQPAVSPGPCFITRVLSWPILSLLGLESKRKRQRGENMFNDSLTDFIYQPGS